MDHLGQKLVKMLLQNLYLENQDYISHPMGINVISDILTRNLYNSDWKWNGHVFSNVLKNQDGHYCWTITDSLVNDHCLAILKLTVCCLFLSFDQKTKMAAITGYI